MAEGEFKENKLNGHGLRWFPNGSLLEQGMYKNNKMHGKGTVYYEDGSIKVVGNFKNGKKDGYAIWYNGYGGIYKEGIFKDGKFMNAYKKSGLDKHKEVCEEIGFKPKTEGFGNCVLRLMELNKY